MVKWVTFEKKLVFFQFWTNAQSIGKIYFKVWFLRSFLQTKLQYISMNIIINELYYTVVRNRVGMEIANDEYKNDECDYIILLVFLIYQIIVLEQMMM